MVDRSFVLEVLRTIDDPEMPINIVDLGIVGDVRIEEERVNPEASRVEVDLLPTFVGCIALPAIESEIRHKLAQLPGVTAVDVTARFDPPWTVDRISEAGRETLRKHGVTVPAGTLHCPFCGSTDVRLDSPFGPTRCRMIYYCEQCRHPFEHLKRLDQPRTLIDIGPLRPFRSND
jgi:ring-1,2-phenylacetyl-CoA epoxidase subunit PaaD